MAVILQSITDQPGPRIEPNVIMQVLQRWSTTDYEVMLESYMLDETTGCLREWFFKRDTATRYSGYMSTKCSGACLF